MKMNPVAIAFWIGSAALGGALWGWRGACIALAAATFTSILAS